MWVNKHWPVDRMNDKLINDNPNKYSAYYQFGNNMFLQNRLSLGAVRMLFGDSRAPTGIEDEHGSFNGVQTHENGLFLYGSRQANWAVRWGFGDICVLASWGLYLFTPAHLMLLPAIIQLAFVPRRWVQQRYFTWHAELLPHTEQVVFHKSFLFGLVHKVIVDIKNLEKVEAEAVPNKLMWTGNIFDNNLVFSDSESAEVFVFDK